jgi:hypothetical protein
MTALRQHINDRFKKHSSAAQTVQEKPDGAPAANDMAAERAEVPESRLKSIAKTLGGMVFSATVTFGLKALIPIIFAAAPAGVAAIAIPVALIGVTAYGFIESARHIRKRLNHHKRKFLNECDVSGKKAFFMALKKNKFELGAFIGSLGLLSVGIVTDLTNFASILNPDKLAEMAAAETAIVSADKLIERGHEHKHAKTMTARLKAAFDAARTRKVSDHHYQPRHAKRKPRMMIQPA